MGRFQESKEGGGGKAQVLFDIFDQSPHYMAPHWPVMNGTHRSVSWKKCKFFSSSSFSESVCNNGTHYGRAYSVRVTIQWCRGGLVPEQTRLDPDSG